MNQLGTPVLPISVREIARLVAADFGVAERHVYGRRSDAASAEARQVVCWIAFDLNGLSSTEIAQVVGRDSSTVRHAFDVVVAKRSSDEAFKTRTDHLSREVALLGRRALSEMLADPDPVEAAERIAGNPLYEAMRVSTLEIAAMAVRLVELENIAGATFQLLDLLDRAHASGRPAGAVYTADVRELIDTVASALQALGYETTTEEPANEKEQASS